jgi:hypothetical protein
MNDKIEKIYGIYENLKKQDCHIDDGDTLGIIRQKDILFGKIMALEEVIKILQQ